MSAKKITKKRPVLVGTDRNALVFGYTSQSSDEILKSGIATIEKARQIVYWPANSRGAFSLAANGAPSGSRVSHPAPVAAVRGVVTVLDVAEAAVPSIEAGPWG